MNKVFLLGNITRDIQLKYLPNQMAVCDLGIAINKRWKDAQGQQQEKTCFVDCVMFGKRCEVLNKYFHKGSRILIEGELDFQQWEDKEGNKRNKLRVMVTDFSFVDKPQQSGNYQPQQQSQQQPQQQEMFNPNAEFEAAEAQGDNPIPF